MTVNQTKNGVNQIMNYKMNQTKNRQNQVMTYEKNLFEISNDDFMQAIENEFKCFGIALKRERFRGYEPVDAFYTRDNFERLIMNCPGFDRYYYTEGMEKAELTDRSYKVFYVYGSSFYCRLYCMDESNNFEISLRRMHEGVIITPENVDEFLDRDASGYECPCYGSVKTGAEAVALDAITRYLLRGYRITALV